MTAKVAVNQIIKPPNVSNLMVSQRLALKFRRVNLILLSIDLPLMVAIRSYAL
ncbi:hypothetical protein HanXRQr2_Chr01g0004781 [Helianthus annuus]|uniref:Uncharacterized protein n=1 Tax=Helianthus annuus TaxID=4232 RepID=A0A9K3P263_HELAN|nr:hypothetical protein HanXRQr2_Chr01g0004781 [Helianthus annuus]KAJ0955595.1 hypothetical protein HanPSC8_Chr01g0004631 [Helianthus annuus]